MTDETEKIAMRAEAALERGDLAAAHDLYMQALADYQHGGAYIGWLVSLMGLAETARLSGDLPGAVARLEQALALAQERGDTPSEGRIMLRLGTLHRTLGNPSVAIAYFDGALPFVVPPDVEKADAPALLVAYDLLTALADLVAAHNRPHDAIAHLRHALVLAQRLDDGQRAAVILDKLATLFDNIGSSADARRAGIARAALERQHI